MRLFPACLSVIKIGRSARIGKKIRHSFLDRSFGEAKKQEKNIRVSHGENKSEECNAKKADYLGKVFINAVPWC